MVSVLVCMCMMCVGGWVHVCCVCVCGGVNVCMCVHVYVCVYVYQCGVCICVCMSVECVCVVCVYSGVHVHMGGNEGQSSTSVIVPQQLPIFLLVIHLLVGPRVPGLTNRLVGEISVSSCFHLAGFFYLYTWMFACVPGMNTCTASSLMTEELCLQPFFVSFC